MKYTMVVKPFRWLCMSLALYILAPFAVVGAVAVVPLLCVMYGLECWHDYFAGGHQQ